jgi:hypothetical protein
VNFRQTGFLEQLRKAGGFPLYEVATEPGAKAFFDFLFTVRNTIHEASVAANGFITSGKGPSWIEIDEGAFAAELWTAVESLGGAESWGLRKMRYRKGADGPVVEPLRLEPFPFAVPLVREGLRLVDRIAGATDIARLLKSAPVPDLMDRPAEDGHFAIDIRNRLALIG